MPKSSPPPRRKFPPTLVALGLVAFAGVSFVGVKFWRDAHARSEIRQSLPPTPGRISAALAQRLADASRQLADPATLRDGLAETARLYHASGYAAEAERCWLLFRTLEPDDARSVYYLADLRRTASDQEGMIDHLRQTTRQAPDYAPAWLRLADALFKSGEIADATAAYTRRLELVRDDPYALLGLARIELQQGQSNPARQRIERLVQVAPQFSPGHNLLAEFLAAEGDQDRALRHRWLGRETGRFRDADDPWLDELIAWCFDYERLCMRGTMEFQSRIGDRGETCFERAVALQPDALTAYELLGNLYLDLGKPARAREHYERGLARVPAAQLTAGYYARLSRACQEMQQPGEAARYAREGLARMGDDPELHDSLGVALRALGDGPGAIAAFERAVALSPNDTSANYNFALALIEQHRLEEAVAGLHRSIELRPTFPDSLALLAQIEIDSGRWRDALRYIQPLYESHPDMPQAREMFAFWHLQSGVAAETQQDLAAAERHYATGTTLDPQNAELHARLGIARLRSGRFSEALPALETFRRIAPQDPQAAFYLGQCLAALGRVADARRLLDEAADLAARSGNQDMARRIRDLASQVR